MSSWEKPTPLQKARDYVESIKYASSVVGTGIMLFAISESENGRHEFDKLALSGVLYGIAALARLSEGHLKKAIENDGIQKRAIQRLSKDQAIFDVEETLIEMYEDFDPLA